MTAHNNPDPTAKKIPLMEVFGPTIQGEGAIIGQPTYFLRFGLCDYLCKKCDSLHAVQPESVRTEAQWLTQGEIFVEFQKHRGKFPNENSTRWVTLSGGNPCIHDLCQLMTMLNTDGYDVAVETQGTFCPNWLLGATAISVSPKGPGMGERLELDKLDEFLRRMQDRIARLPNPADDVRKPFAHVAEAREHAAVVAGTDDDARRQVAARDAVRDIRRIHGLAAELRGKAPADQRREQRPPPSRRRRIRASRRASLHIPMPRRDARRSRAGA